MSRRASLRSASAAVIIALPELEIVNKETGESWKLSPKQREKAENDINAIFVFDYRSCGPLKVSGSVWEEIGRMLEIGSAPLL
jgi:hypothetical protein